MSILYGANTAGFITDGLAILFEPPSITVTTAADERDVPAGADISLREAIRDVPAGDYMAADRFMRSLLFEAQQVTG